MEEKPKNWLSLRRRKDFLLLKKAGQRIRKKGFFIIYRENKLSFSRFALFFPKWTGKAVYRNRFKRWARQFLKERKKLQGVDLMLGFEKKEKTFYKDMKYEYFYLGFDELLQSISL